MKESNGQLNIVFMADYFRTRQQQLANLEPRIGRKLVTLIRDKIQHEMAQAERLVAQREEAASVQKQYSFVLNPHYFEQKFFR